MPREYLLALMLEKVPVGTSFKRNKLPLHCTVMRWFTLHRSTGVKDLEKKVKELSRTTEELRLGRDGWDYFGSKNNTRCLLIARNDDLLTLHTKMLVWLVENKSPPKDMQWIGAGYRPHVTVPEATESSAISHVIPCTHLTLITREHGIKAIKQHFAFKSE